MLRSLGCARDLGDGAGLGRVSGVKVSPMTPWLWAQKGHFKLNGMGVVCITFPPSWMDVPGSFSKNSKLEAS